MRNESFVFSLGLLLMGSACTDEQTEPRGSAENTVTALSGNVSKFSSTHGQGLAKSTHPFVRRGKRVRASGNTAAFELDDAALHLIAGESAAKSDRRAKALLDLSVARTQSERRTARTTLEQLDTGEFDPDYDFSLRTLSVSRVGYECLRGTAALRIGADGQALRQYAHCDESWQPEGGTVEQRFSFAERPTGHGPLVVRLEARFGRTGPVRVQRDAQGLHLASLDGQQVIYGHGTWVDAAGQRSAVPARWTGTSIELRVDEAIVANSKYPAVLDPIVGPEMGTEPAVLKASYMGHNPEVASDGSSYLAVYEVQGQIRAVRVDPTGTPLDVNWLLLSNSATHASYYPQVTSGDGRYLVTWSELPSGQDSVVLGRIVNPDGTLAGSAPFKISQDGAIYSSAIWDKNKFVAVWQHFNDDDTSAIHIGFFGSDGTAIANSEKSVSPKGSVTAPHLAMSGSQYFVAWEKNTNSSYNSAWGSRVDSNGTALDTTPLQLGTGETGVSETYIDVESDGANFLATWQRGGAVTTVQGSVIAANGTINPKNVLIGRATGAAGLPTVDFDNANYVVAWTDARNSNSLYATKVSPAGTLLGSNDTKVSSGAPVYVAFGSDHPALAFNGTNHLLAYYAANSQGIQGSLFSNSLGIVKDNIPLTPVPHSQGMCPSVTWDGAKYVLGFYDERDSKTNPGVRVMRYDATGAALDASSHLLSNDTSSGTWVQLKSSGSSSSLALWSGPNGKWTRTFATNGSLGPLTALTLPSGASWGVVGANGPHWLLPFFVNSTLYGRVLDAAGTSVGTDITLGQTTGNTNPVVLGTPSGSLVVYMNSGTWAVPIGTDRSLGTAEKLSNSVCFVDGAHDGTKTLVVWSCSAASSLMGRYFENGTWGTPFEISATSAGYGGSVTWDGSRFWVTWESPEHHLVSRNVGSNGTMELGTTVVSEVSYCPDLASDGQGHALLTYSRPSEDSSSYRVYSRLLSAGGTSGDPATGGTSSGIGGAAAGGSSPIGTSSTGGVSTTGGTSAGGATEFGTTPLIGGTGSITAGGGASSTTGLVGAAGNPGVGGGGNPRTDVLPNGGSSDASNEDPSDSGCSCTVPARSRTSNSVGWFGGLALLGLVVIRRRFVASHRQ